MSRFIETTIAGNEFLLLGDRGIYWDQHRVLMVTDAHLGKEATFRHHGLPVPRGSSDGTLARISRMLERTEASELVILGDLFHARSSLSDDVCESLDRFFARHPGVAVRLVRGNHDAHVGQLPSRWPIAVVESEWMVDNVALAHHPAKVTGQSKLRVCGHLHPAMRYHSATERLGKLPCFWLHQQCLVLPAVGQFTGTHLIRPSRGDQVWMVLEDELFVYRDSRSVLKGPT